MHSNAVRFGLLGVAATVLLAAIFVLLTTPGADGQVGSALPLDELGLAPADDATIGPGAPTLIEEAGQCTANFVFVAGERVFLGQSAHCASLQEAAATDGCRSESLPLGTPVTVAGAEHPAALAYSSWITMQQVGEDDPNACLFNDFALVELHPDDHARVDPTVPHWGGPNGLNTTGTEPGEPLYSYGGSDLRLGVEALSPLRGASLGTTAEGWSHPAYTVTPGVPGDSGAGFLDSQGNAVGSLSTLAVAPLPGSNGITDLHRALQYLHAHTDLRVELRTGTEPFTPGL